MTIQIILAHKLIKVMVTVIRLSYARFYTTRVEYARYIEAGSYLITCCFLVQLAQQARNEFLTNNFTRNVLTVPHAVHK